MIAPTIIDYGVSRCFGTGLAPRVDVPSATMICGDFSNIYVGFWGDRFTLEINRYEPTHFKSGVIQARMIISMDVAILHPSAFVVATSIT